MTPNENHSLSEQIAERTCKFCNAAFTTPGMTLRHEQACAGRTPEQRHAATWAREHYRKSYGKAAHSGQGPKLASNIDEPVVEPRRQRMAHNEARERSLAKQREYNKTRPRKNKAAQLEREVKKASILLTGQRVQITLSLDWETARKLIIQLIPDISIDGVQLK